MHTTNAVSHKLRNRLLTLSVFAIGAALQLHAGEAATATYTYTQPTPGTYDYSLTLNNTGTTTIGTFWFSWIPGAGFMSTAPTSINSPAGWSDAVTNAGSALRWVTTTDLLAPGDSLSGFEFDSTLTPAELAGPFAGPGLGTGDPVDTFFVYIAAPLADPGVEGVASASSSAPEPSTTLLAALAIGLLGYRRFARPAARN